MDAHSDSDSGSDYDSDCNCDEHGHGDTNSGCCACDEECEREEEERAVIQRAKRAVKCPTIRQLHAALVAAKEDMPIPPLKGSTLTPWQWWSALLAGTSSLAGRTARAAAVSSLRFDDTPCTECDDGCLANCSPRVLCQLAVRAADVRQLFELFRAHGGLPWARNSTCMSDDTLRAAVFWIVRDRQDIVDVARSMGLDPFANVMAYHEDGMGLVGYNDSVMRVMTRMVATAAADTVGTVKDATTFVTRHGAQVSTVLYAKLLDELGLAKATQVIPGLADALTAAASVGVVVPVSVI